MQTKTTTQIENRLKEADFPAKVIPSVMKEVESFQPEAQELFALWFDKDYLDDGAFDLLGITPKVIREKFPRITDVGVLIIYSHLIIVVRNEFAVLCSQVERKERIAKVERDLGMAMISCSKQGNVNHEPKD